VRAAFRTRSCVPAGSTTTLRSTGSSFCKRDGRHAGDSGDGVIARRQIAQVLVNSLGSDQASHKTFELVAEAGPAPDDFEALFGRLDADREGVLDGVCDLPNMPLADEPQRVRDDFAKVAANR
jgi:hypothetical protein